LIEILGGACQESGSGDVLRVEARGITFTVHFSKVLAMNRVYSILVLGFAAATMVASSAQAAIYFVDRSLTNGSSTATLTGTVDIPIGNYTIQNTVPDPFTDVNLTLTVNATSYYFTQEDTSLIFGTGRFDIDATTTSLTFDPIGNSSNPADLSFWYACHTNRYSVGSDGFAAFEVAYTDAGVFASGPVFPITFGTATVPEPTTIIIWSLPGGLAIGLGWWRRRRR